MLNMTGLLRSKQTFEVTLSRKPTANEVQNVRKRVEYVKAHDCYEAKDIALSMPNNRAFKVSSVREVK